jgi:hypothetical protein
MKNENFHDQNPVFKGFRASLDPSFQAQDPQLDHGLRVPRLADD